jgi:hypothetical protein
VSGFFGSKYLLELLHTKNVDELSFFAPLVVSEGTGRFGPSQDFELRANSKRRDRVFHDLAFEHTDRALIFGVAAIATA